MGGGLHCIAGGGLLQGRLRPRNRQQVSVARSQEVATGREIRLSDTRSVGLFGGMPLATHRYRVLTKPDFLTPCTPDACKGSPKVDVPPPVSGFVSFFANVPPRNADIDFVNQRQRLGRLPWEKRDGDPLMHKKTRDSQVQSKHNVCAYAHGRLMRSDLSRRMSVNPKASTKQRSDMDRRASFSVLYPAV